MIQTSLPVPQAIPGIAHIIAIASGKGGVGKSTVAANLALAFQSLGKSVGLCDCDLHGPTISQMFVVDDRPTADDNGKIYPIESHGIRMMSMGFLTSDETPAILRGPLLTRYTQQFLLNVAWGDLDILILDLPPGTGDIQLTVVQTVQLSGAVIVTTPQEIALAVARKASSMFQKTNVSILGVIENMSHFLCPSDQKRYDIFGAGGGANEAARLNVPLLAEIPLDIATRQAGDNGAPIMIKNPQSPISKAFINAAKEILVALPPKIIEQTLQAT